MNLNYIIIAILLLLFFSNMNNACTFFAVFMLIFSNNQLLSNNGTINMVCGKSKYIIYSYRQFNSNKYITMLEKGT